MKLGFLILAHDDPANTARLVRLLLETDSTVCLHYDLKAGEAPLNEIRERLGDLADRLLLAKRVRVSWGEWSIVEATLNGLAALLGSGHELDYIHLMSGSDYPIRPVSEFRNFLARHAGVDFIESHAVNRKKWVKDGLSRERFQYRHFFNFKTHPRLFHWCWKIQAALKIRRKPPAGLSIHMGSQWWTLTAATCREVLARGFSKETVRFFRHSWIPDEMVVQTLAAQTGHRHSNRHLTLYQFNDYGVPIVYHDSHAGYLSRQPFFFARKFSPNAITLRDELDLIVSGGKKPCEFQDQDIGSPTSEYSDFMALHRNGLPGLRVPGQVPQGRSRELAWNINRYIVIVGTSTYELKQAAALLRGIPQIVCHGFLFGADAIDFADGASALAGYRRSATALRDHAQASFLADIIKAKEGRTTCFLMRRHDAPTLLKDVLRWDPHATLIMLKGGVMRAYTELHAPKPQTAGTELDLPRVSEAARAAAFQEDFFRSADHVPLPGPEPSATVHQVDVLDRNWPCHMVQIMLESGVEVRQAATLLGVQNIDSERPPAIDVALATEFLSWGSGREQKARILAEVLAPAKTPYLVVVGPDRQANGSIAAALSTTGMLSYPEEQPVTVPALLRDVLRYKVSQPHRPAVFVAGADDISMIEAISLDPDARILAVTVETAVVLTGRSSATDAIMERPWDEAQANLKSAVAPVMVVNAQASDWAREVAGFIGVGFAGLSGSAGRIEQSLLAAAQMERAEDDRVSAKP